MSSRLKKMFKASTFQIIFLSHPMPSCNESRMSCKLTIFIRWKISGCIVKFNITYHVALECSLAAWIPFFVSYLWLKVSWHCFKWDVRHALNICALSSENILESIFHGTISDIFEQLCCRDEGRATQMGKNDFCKVLELEIFLKQLRLDFSSSTANYFKPSKKLHITLLPLILKNV